MNDKKDFCHLCNQLIRKDEVEFRFPTMPQGHELSDLGEATFHLNCIKSIDKKRNIGDAFATNIQKGSDESITPVLLRNGNIIVRAGLTEKTISFYNYEDFARLWVPIEILDELNQLDEKKAISSRMLKVSFLEDDKIRLDYIYASIILTELRFPRFKEMLEAIDREKLQEHLKNFEENELRMRRVRK